MSANALAHRLGCATPVLAASLTLVLPGTAVSAVTPYDPEFAWSDETGAKTQWLHDRLRVNVAGLFTDYKDLQGFQLVRLCCVAIGDAATAEIQGVETEMVCRPIAGLNINASYSWLDAEFERFANGVTVDHTGNTLPRASAHTFNLGAEGQWAAGEIGMFLARVDWTRQSKIDFEASNTPLEGEKRYDLVDARLALRAHDDAWEMAL